MLLADYKLNRSIEKPCDAFARGISYLFPIELFSILNQVLLLFICSRMNYKCL